MDLDVRDLELVEALAQHKTLTAAASQLFVSQPALSQRLTKLEQRLGVPLFDRAGRTLQPTRAGARAIQAAQATLADLRLAERDIRAIRDGRLDPVRLASQCTTNYYWLSPILSEFRAELPGSEVRVDVKAADAPIEMLLAERIDVALVSKLEPQMDRIRLHRLFDDELLTLVAPDHAWAGRTSVEPEEFASQHLVLFESYDPARSPAVPLPLPVGARPGSLSTPPVNSDVLVEFAASGDAVTVLPSWIARPYLEEGRVVSVAVGDVPQVRTWYCATRHGERTEPVEAFTRVLDRHLRSGDPADLVGGRR